MEQMLAHCKSTPCLNLLSFPGTLLSCKIKKKHCKVSLFGPQGDTILISVSQNNGSILWPRTRCGCLLCGQMCCELCFDFTCAHQSRLPLSAAGSQSIALLGAPRPSAALPFTPRRLTQHFMKRLAAATRPVDGQFVL